MEGTRPERELEAAVIGVFHPKWDERPILIIVPHGATGKVEKKTLREKFKDHKLPAAGIDQVRGIIS